MTSEDQWSTDELEAAVEAYAEMYRAGGEGRKVNKAQIYRDLEERFGRRNKAFERRMMNISHVVVSLGGEPVRGLLPASNIGANTQPIIERRVIRKERVDSELRSEFKRHDLEAIFNNDFYLKGKHRCSAHFWIPLLALFTGARLNELCQLDRADIVLIEGIWCIDINRNGRKRLKNLSSARVVPLHSTLISSRGLLRMLRASIGL